MNRPEGVAIVDVARSWTYAEASTAAGQISTALNASGIGPGDRVGVHCMKGAEGFLAMHGVVSAGAIAVPLDPGSPATRLTRICEQMQIDVIISHAPRAKGLGEMHELRPIRAVIGLDAPAPGITAIDAATLAGLAPTAPATVDIDEAAYIITTSGSTGEPKGMVHTHRSALAYADMTIRTYDMTPEDRVSDIAPHHFDISTHSLWSVPRVGATNIVVSEPFQRLPASHSQLLQDQAVTFWYSVPFLLQQLVLRGDLANRDFSALRWVHFGGEVISPQVIGEMMGHCPNARFANIFGPAETNQCTLAVFDSPPDLGAPVSIGYPLDHSVIRVCHTDAATPDDASLVAPGEVGEMWTHTPQLMDGYWGQPEKNEQVLHDIDGQTFYRSGDLVSVDERGEFSFFGRIDHQVKVRGFRIELEGVELALEELCDVENVVVGVKRTDSGEDEIVAGLLGAPDGFDQSNFLQAAASVLPAYAVPTRTVHIASPVFTGSGKLNRRVLREQAAASTPEGHVQ